MSTAPHLRGTSRDTDRCWSAFIPRRSTVSARREPAGLPVVPVTTSVPVLSNQRGLVLRGWQDLFDTLLGLDWDGFSMEAETGAVALL